MASLAPEFQVDVPMSAQPVPASGVAALAGTGCASNVHPRRTPHLNKTGRHVDNNVM
jgi:hypothetical protein